MAVLPRAVSLELVSALRAQLEAHLDSGRDLTPVSDDRQRPPGDLRPPARLLGPEDLSRGQAHFRRLTNFAAVADPLLRCSKAVPLAFEPLLRQVASSYLGVVPAIGTLNLRKSFVNDLPEYDTLLFHCDDNNRRFLKFFFYLADVGSGGGPFCYVRGSHRKKFSGWRSSYRWPRKLIEDRYGPENICYMTARAGDVIVADTTGFHRGSKVRTADRSMFTVNYVVHPEYWGRSRPARISGTDVAALPADSRPLVDYLDIVASAEEAPR